MTATTPEESPKPFKPFWLVLFVFILCLALSFLPRNFHFLGVEWKQINIISDFQKEAIAKDSMPVNLDSLAEVIAKASDTIHFDGTPLLNFGKGKDLKDISHFVNALHHSKKKKGKTRIAWFGDSMVEGDLFVEEWRKRMQDTFGGHGVGWVPIVSVVENFRLTIRTQHSEDWQHHTILNKETSHLALGVGGEAFIPAEGSWVKYTAVNRPHLDYFEEAYVLVYAPQGGFNLQVSVGDSILNIPVEAKSTLQKVKLFSGAHCKQTKIVVQHLTAETWIYGVSFESQNGVFIDNMGLRGSTGLFLANINPTSLNTDWVTEHPYDLIVLEYGLNVMKKDAKNYSWFLKSFDKTIQRLQALYPDATIVLLGVGDRSEKVDGNYVTMPMLTQFIQYQQQMAVAHQLFFWSIYNAMGGDGSMQKWAFQKPSLANKDFTHINARGGQVLGDKLFDACLFEFNRQRKRIPNE